VEALHKLEYLLDPGIPIGFSRETPSAGFVAIEICKKF